MELPLAMLTLIRRLVPCDSASYNEINPVDAEALIVVSGGASVTPEESRVFAAHAHENPLVAYQSTTRDGLPRRLSDFIGRRELHRLPIYSLVYRSLALEAQLGCALQTTESPIVGLALNRERGDFSDRDVAVMTAAASVLVQVWSTARLAVQDSLDACTGSLTPRQREVIELVACGATNQQIALALLISERTVAKHLEHAYRVLGVSNRTSAAAVWRAQVRNCAY